MNELLQYLNTLYCNTNIENSNIINIISNSIIDNNNNNNNNNNVVDNLNRYVFAPIEFYKYNVAQGIANFYGVHSWHWYVYIYK